MFSRKRACRRHRGFHSNLDRAFPMTLGVASYQTRPRGQHLPLAVDLIGGERHQRPVNAFGQRAPTRFWTTSCQMATGENRPNFRSAFSRRRLPQQGEAPTTAPRSTPLEAGKDGNLGSRATNAFSCRLHSAGIPPATLRPRPLHGAPRFGWRGVGPLRRSHGHEAHAKTQTPRSPSQRRGGEGEGPQDQFAAVPAV